MEEEELCRGKVEEAGVSYFDWVHTGRSGDMGRCQQKVFVVCVCSVFNVCCMYVYEVCIYVACMAAVRKAAEWKLCAAVRSEILYP